ncbi:UDP-galactopyranose mutase [Granulicella rosea]|uniref:UDP-galactopyranose mutase n=1 Tax=Granulicella rosea TaxID=474952 RepID=A0A239MQS1_9BACT|nr:UDP-galactopyranose mutase [Granulicella rosea]SNT44189.1 UDP-galactopyranose mutase [Granulicella rosea]
MQSDSRPEQNILQDSCAEPSVVRSVDLLCFSHLRWRFVTQRPQHLLTRCARDRRTFFWEEPYWDADDNGDGTPTLEVMQEQAQLWVLRPHLPRAGNADDMLRSLLAKFLEEFKLERYVRWYYTPMALGFTQELQPEATVYDCMDELSGFLGAPPELQERERQLFAQADVVFTGGMSLYESKRKQHANVHAFPSSIDVSHFAQAQTIQNDPNDQSEISHPRAGFFGVLDERFDKDLLAQLAELCPHVQFILIGPVVKIDPASLPQADNIHYLGAKSYMELPAYLAGWDVALLPFALNEATRYISPTKTPEYLAAGKPVVSTPIHDVISGYGNAGLVAIAHDAQEFADAIQHALQPQPDAWRTAVAEQLATGSWDKTWAAMWREIERVRERSAQYKTQYVSPLRVTPVEMHSLTRRTMRPVRGESYDYLVVGAGLAGGVLAERLANDMDKRVLIVDKRDHIGGNTFDYYDAAGILVHKYGPHIFHTNSTEVMQYLSQFTSWRNYEHRVLAQVDGQLLPIPINIDTIERMYNLSLDGDGMQQFLAARAEAGRTIRTSEDIVVSRVGRELYEKFFRNYTRKQWGLDPSELDASVAGRIPVRHNRDDRYFTDTYQAMPLHGFTRMFERMLDSKRITIRTGVAYQDVAHAYPNAKVIFTGPVDEYFDYRFGALPYRSLEFKHETHDRERFQAAPVVNYPNDQAYTRITEFKYLTGQVSPRTSIVYEYPKAEGDPYYPIPRPRNMALYAKYKELADRKSEVTFVGRLATYKYYNMDQVVAQALTTYRRISEQERKLAVAPVRPLALTATAV